MNLFNLYYSIVSKNPFLKNSFQSFFKKVKYSIGHEMNAFFKDAEKIFFSDTSSVISYNEELEENIFMIFEAIRDKVKITFDYFSMKTKSSKKVIISPLAIKYFNRNYYLAGHIKAKDKIYTWAVNRISNLNQTTQKRDKVNFDGKRYLENGYGIYTGKIIDVKIEFSKEIAPFIKERIWHKNQKFIEKLKELQKESRVLSKSLRSIGVKIAKASEELHREIFNARIKGVDSKKLEDKLLTDNLFSLVVPQITDSYDTKKN